MILLFKIVEFQGEHNTIIVHEFVAPFADENAMFAYIHPRNQASVTAENLLKYRKVVFDEKDIAINATLAPSGWKYELLKIPELELGTTIKYISAWSGLQVAVITAFNNEKIFCIEGQMRAQSVVDITDIIEIVKHNFK